jgi:hypothetical protein
MKRQPVPTPLRDELIGVAKDKGFFSAEGAIYYSKFAQEWRVQKRVKRVTHEPPCKKTVRKFFTETKSHDAWFINGLCWMLLDTSLEKWEESNLISQLSGLWLSRYSYTGVEPDSNSFNGNQFSLEYIKVAKGRIKGSNIQSVSGSSLTHRYTFHGEIHLDRFVPGIWISKDRDRIGSFLLCLHTTRQLLIGKHLGNDEENSIQHGPWILIKVNPVEMSIEEILQDSEALELQDYDYLDGIFSSAHQAMQSVEFNTVIKKRPANESL